MIYRTSKEKINEYYLDAEVIGQSRLKLLPLGVDVFNKYENEVESDLFFEEKTHFVIGSAVDCQLTQKEGAFDEDYFISDLQKKPSDTIMSIVQMVFDSHQRTKPDGDDFMPLDREELQEVILMACEFHQYQATYKPATKISKVIEQGKDYYKSLIEAVGKQVLSVDQFLLVQSICTSILNDPKCGKYFRMGENSKRYDVFFQKIIYFEYQGVRYKCLLDMLVIDHQEKTMQVIDIKTLFDYTLMFPTSVRKRRYDFQVVFYSLAVDSLKAANPYYKEYKVINPAFIVETTKPNCQGKPLFFECTDSLIHLAMNGRENLRATYQYVTFALDPDLAERKLVGVPTSRTYGIEETVQLHKWHLENGFEHDKIVVDTGNHLMLDWEGIKHESTSR